MGSGGLDKPDKQSRIVKSPVIIDHTAREALRDRGWNKFDRLGPRNDPRSLHGVTSGQHIVQLHSDAVEQFVQNTVTRDQKFLLADQIGGILEKSSAFAKRGDSRAKPHTPWPLVQPEPSLTPTPTTRPAASIQANEAAS